MAKKLKQSKDTDLVVYIAFSSEYGYFHPMFQPLVWSGRDCPANPSSDELVNGLYLTDLFITAQGNNEDPTIGQAADSDRARRLYAFELEYRHIHAVDLSKAERMARTLRKVEDRLEKLRAEYGPTRSFGQWARLVAMALGAEKFAMKVRDRSATYAENEWHLYSLNEAVDVIDGRIEAWRRGEEFPLRSIR